ncbi:MAG: phosphatidylglycerophosphatase A [Phycisphaerales bacterium]|nr:phosphatidylglycerophosphatase A [Phycisphaerales bacterium]
MNTMSAGAEWMLTTAGLGHRKPASGTWGSMPPVVLAAILIAVGAGPGDPLAWVYYTVLSLVLVVYSGACIVFGVDAEAKWSKDPGQVVADETAGQCITLMMIPSMLLTTPISIAMALLGCFLLFRAFDILKPWPAGAMQSIAGGWGVLLDDIFAGLMGGAVVILGAMLFA